MPNLPQLQELPEGFLITILTSAGQVCFHFEEMTQVRSHELQTDLTVWQEIPGLEVEPFTGRLNILSLNNRSEYRRQLDDAFGKGQWTSLLNRACQIAKQAWSEKDWSIDLNAVETDMETRYAIRPLVLEGLPSILFGAGDIGKTYLALWLAERMLAGKPVLDGKGPSGSVLMVDYESTERDTKRRLMKLGLESFDGFIYWPGRGRPLPEMAPALSRAIRERDAALILVDSAALACGGDPKEEEVATRYFNTLKKLGVSSVTIAHMTKDERDDRHPFGSIFWYLSARMVWNVKGGEAEANPKHLGLFCTKSNEDVRHRPFGLRMDFRDNKVTVEREELRGEFTEYLALPARIRTLTLYPKSVKQLAEELSARPDTIARTLRRMSGVINLGPAEDGSGLWGLKADEDQY